MEKKTYYNSQGKALGARHVEYENISKAAAEIIDNSIEAHANTIYIFMESRHDDVTGKTITANVTFYDNGDGMTAEELQEYVRDGSSSKTETGLMGKFGVGLNQASLFASPKFEVYSWVNLNEVYYQSIDYREMRINQEYYINPSKKVKFPSKYFLPDFIPEHGTIVVWSELEKDNQFRPSTVAERMSVELGRIFRKYIQNNQIKILLSPDFQKPLICEPRDPLMLSSNDYFLGDPMGSSKKYIGGECLFEPFQYKDFVNGEKVISVPYFDENKNISFSNVIITASVIKEKFYYKAAYKDNYDKPGDTEIGKYLKKMANGITVLRANREIDFDYFDFYDSVNAPNDRWFKIQIAFTRELDDVFGVSNNKQHVELKSVDESSSIALDLNSPYYPIWLRLKDIIVGLVSAMRSRNSKIASEAKNDYFSNFLNEYNEKDNEQESTVSMPKKTNTNDLIDKKQDEIKQPIIKTIVDKYKADLAEKGIIVYYDSISGNKFYSYYFDRDIRKFVITFNNKFCKNKLDSKSEYLLALVIRELSKQPSNSESEILLLSIVSDFENILKK